MDTTAQLYDEDATGWKRGLYDDIKHTFRAPIVNWIFRTTMANHPKYLRHVWGQVKPAFETREFGRVSVEYRDSILSAVEAESKVPSYRGGELAVEPAEYAELRGQLATFDMVAPRLAVFFELVDRSLSNEPVGTDPADSRASTEPLPAHLDRGRGIPPTLASFDNPPAEIALTIDSIRSFHGLDDGLPSIYRCLAQWPGYLDPAWSDLEPTLRDDGFTDGCAAARTVVESYVESLPYVPQLDPETLPGRIDDDAVANFRELFREFNRGPIGTVVPAIHVFADSVGVAGERSFR